MIESILTQEQQMVKGGVAELARRELAPRAAEIDRSAAFPWDNFRVLAKHGFTGMNVPEQFGGTGADVLSFVLAVEEIAKICGSTALVLLAHHFMTQGIVLGGSPDVKEKFLSPLAKGEKLAAFAVHEPNSGCAHSAIETRAMKADDRYHVNGSKFFVTPAGEADAYLILVITDRSKRSIQQMIGCFSPHMILIICKRDHFSNTGRRHFETHDNGNLSNKEDDHEKPDPFGSQHHLRALCDGHQERAYRHEGDLQRGRRSGQQDNHGGIRRARNHRQD
jgi:hypothetical protein